MTNKRAMSYVPSPLYADGLHLSVAGHRVAGEAIGRELLRLLRDK